MSRASIAKRRERIRQLADLLPDALVGNAVERLEELIKDDEGVYSDKTLETIRACERGEMKFYPAEEVFGEENAAKRSRVA